MGTVRTAARVRRLLCSPTRTFLTSHGSCSSPTRHICLTHETLPCSAWVEAHTNMLRYCDFKGSVVTNCLPTSPLAYLTAYLSQLLCAWFPPDCLVITGATWHGDAEGDMWAKAHRARHGTRLKSMASFGAVGQVARWLERADPQSGATRTLAPPAPPAPRSQFHRVQRHHRQALRHQRRDCAQMARAAPRTVSTGPHARTTYPGR